MLEIPSTLFYLRLARRSGELSKHHFIDHIIIEIGHVQGKSVRSAPDDPFGIVPVGIGLRAGIHMLRSRETGDCSGGVSSKIKHSDSLIDRLGEIQILINSDNYVLGII